MTEPLPAPRVEAVETVMDDWFTLRRFRVITPLRDGGVARVSRFSLHRGDRVAVLPHSRNRGTVLLTRQFRLPVLLQDGAGDGELCEVPGGLVDDGDVLASVRREAEEETGYRLREPVPAFVTYLAPQLSHERTHLFTAEYATGDRVGPGGGVAAEGEDIGVLELPLAAAVERVTGGGPADAKTLLLLLHAQANRLCSPPDSARRT